MSRTGPPAWIDPSSQPSEDGTPAPDRPRPLSTNFKKAQRHYRNAITRAATAGTKAARESRLIVEELRVNRDEQGLETIDHLRKEMIVAAAMIETDAHFHDVVNNFQAILSEKERRDLCNGVTAYLNAKARPVDLPPIKESILELQQVLTDHQFQFTEAVSPAETADISDSIARSPLEDEELLERDLLDSSISDADIESVILTPRNEALEVPHREQFHSASSSVRPPANDREAPASDQVDGGERTGIFPAVPSNIRSNVEHRGTHIIGSRLSRTAPVTAFPETMVSCPVCHEDHDILECNSPIRPAYCAKNELCVHCTSARHLTHQCPLQIAQASPISRTPKLEAQENGGRFMSAARPIGASTPLDRADSGFPSPPETEARENNRNISGTVSPPRVRKTTLVEEESDSECREPEKSRKMSSKSKDLSYYDVDTILTKFSADPMQYKRFMTMFEKQVMQNSRLTDDLRLALLEKKLVGEAKCYFINVGDARKAVEASLKALRAAFQDDSTGANEALARFQKLTFHETNYKQATRELLECNTLIMTLEDLGQDVVSPGFVRSLAQKLPRSAFKLVRELYANNAQPSTNDVIELYTDYLKAEAFYDKFCPATASERTKEIPDEAVLAAEGTFSNPTQSSKVSNQAANTRVTAPVKSNSNTANVNSNSAQSSKKNDKKKKSKTASQSSGPTQGNRVNQGYSAGAGMGYFGSQATVQQNNQTHQSHGNAPHTGVPAQNPQGSSSYGIQNGGKQASTPAQKEKKASIPISKGQPGETLEPCYKYGRGYDERFIAHTFPRDSPTGTKCCFICGPGHSILQCALSSYDVRQFFRQSNSCHNCAQRNHRTEECASYSTCAYCQESGQISKLPFAALRTTDGHRVLALVDSGASLSVLSHESAERFGLAILATKTLTISGYSRTTTEESNIYQMSFSTDGDPYSMLIAGAPRLPKTRFISPLLSSEDLGFLRDNKVNTNVISSDQKFNGQFIDMILGNDLLARLLGTSRRLLLPSERFVELTPFAPIVFPPPRSSLPPPESVRTLIEAFISEGFITALTTPPDSKDPVDRLHSEISQLWNLDNLGIEEPGPIEGKKTELQDLIAWFEQNVRFDDEGNLLVSLPWNGKQLRLASNRGVAVKRLEQLVISLKKKNNLLQDYDEIIRKQLDSGIIELVTPEMDDNTDPRYYIPHRVVEKLTSLTTKLRIVLDASSKKGGELSLNDCLEAGPSMLVDLFDILIRSRMPDYLVVADIEKAFHQVRMVPEDRDCTRFLWLKDIAKPPVRSNIAEYRFTRIPFGMTSSPFLLAATINHFLRDMKNPIAERIRENIYVDNVMLTTNNREEIQSLRIDSREAFNQMNMRLREYITNCPGEMEKFPKDEISSETTIKLLGYLWDTVNDTYTIKLAQLLETHPTKRQVASRMAETFDPLGNLAPLFVSFKLLMRDLWVDGIDWKHRIPKSLLPRWDAIRKQFSELSITIPRLLRPRGGYKNVQLLVFSDASKDTYACAVYIMYEYDDREPEIGLLTAKSKIKPSSSKTLTIPRLELLAIEIGTRIAMSVVKAMTSEHPCSVRFFSDAMVALYWVLRNEQKKCWVSNRVKGIHEVCDSLKSLEIPNTFHHCPTDLNPADIATRGMGSEELKNCTLWFHGPGFLKEDPSKWPCRLEGNITCPSDFRELISSEIIATKKNTDTTDSTEQSVGQSEFDALTDALKGMCMVTQRKDQYVSFVPYERSNSLSRVVSYTHSTLNCLLKLFKRHEWKSPIMQEFVKSKSIPDTSLMGLKGRAIARRLVFIEHYKEAASQGQEFPSKLLPVEGSDGIVRTHRRVPSPVLASDAYKRILVHKKHRLARLVVEETHLKNVHLPATYLVTALRTRYWILTDKQLADSVCRSCVPCQKVNNKPFAYPFARRIPRFRTTPSVPFQHVGLDYMGPLSYRLDDGISLGKAYVLVYTCLVTRATHLELIPDGTAETYVQGLKNVFSRRGIPHSVYSDNARTFTLGSKIISDDLKRYVPSTSFTNFLATFDINFHYITPLAPWQGGIYERVVGIVKHQMRKEIGKTTKSFFSLNHVIVRVESMINSRPLTPNPRDINDLPALRPMDFILPTVLIDLPSERDGLKSNEQFDPTRNSSVTERRTLDHLAGLDEVIERLWDIWSSAYLAYLRENAHPEKRTSLLKPRVGQLVLIYTDKSPRHNWPLGVIDSLKYSKDGSVRTATVRCRDKFYERAVNQLIPLEVNPVDDPPASEQVESDQQFLVPPDSPNIATFPVYSQNPNTPTSNNKGIRNKDQKVHRVGEELINAGPKVLKSPDLDACRSGAPKDRNFTTADKSGHTSDKDATALESSRRGVGLKSCCFDPTIDSTDNGSDVVASRSGATRGGVECATPVPDVCRSDTSGKVVNRTAPNLDAGCSGTSTKEFNQFAPNLGIRQSSSTRRGVGLKSCCFDPTIDSSDTGSDMAASCSDAARRRMKCTIPAPDVCRSGTSGKGFNRVVPNLDASCSGASTKESSQFAPNLSSRRAKTHRRRIGLKSYCFDPTIDSSGTSSEVVASRSGTTTEDTKQSDPTLGASRSGASKCKDDQKSSGSEYSQNVKLKRPRTIDDWAKIRLPIHRVRPYQPRKAKAKLARYVLITQAAEPQTPRSVDSCQVPDQASVPLQTKMH
ncbi:hypothetical protein CRE_21846 [Caenorhabditis remanei]|uniref:Integrase catalytic domain-containing protein n=1 Tax=Caenorhabditis remanei TaxID=31234 RepID=E3MU87_CAERE|nr:hypothetical protein CRE_21846 [Caenorhabditis remanei]